MFKIGDKVVKINRNTFANKFGDRFAFITQLYENNESKDKDKLWAKFDKGFACAVSKLELWSPQIQKQLDCINSIDKYEIKEHAKKIIKTAPATKKEKHQFLKNRIVIKELAFDKLKAFRRHDRLKVFYHKGSKCVECGVEGTRLVWSKQHKHDGLHLDVFTTDGLLMTVDHLIPRSVGGRDVMSNFQPMCSICNSKKGSTGTNRFKMRLFEPIILRSVAELDTSIQKLEEMYYYENERPKLFGDFVRLVINPLNKKLEIRGSIYKSSKAPSALKIFKENVSEIERQVFRYFSNLSQDNYENNKQTIFAIRNNSLIAYTNHKDFRKYKTILKVT
jgi:5-methylcytosine-specific restriction endonuclease McrA